MNNCLIFILFIKEFMKQLYRKLVGILRLHTALETGMSSVSVMEPCPPNTEWTFFLKCTRNVYKDCSYAGYKEWLNKLKLTHIIESLFFAQMELAGKQLYKDILNTTDYLAASCHASNKQYSKEKSKGKFEELQ